MLNRDNSFGISDHRDKIGIRRIKEIRATKGKKKIQVNTEMYILPSPGQILLMGQPRGVIMSSPLFHKMGNYQQIQREQPSHLRDSHKYIKRFFINTSSNKHLAFMSNDSTNGRGYMGFCCSSSLSPVYDSCIYHSGEGSSSTKRQGEITFEAKFAYSIGIFSQKT